MDNFESIFAGHDVGRRCIGVFPPRYNDEASVPLASRYFKAIYIKITQNILIKRFSVCVVSLIQKSLVV